MYLNNYRRSRYENMNKFKLKINEIDRFSKSIIFSTFYELITIQL